MLFRSCGGRGGSGYDRDLIDFLRQWRVPATLFINSRWIDTNPGIFSELATDPLFEIGNHGTQHRPLSVSGRSAYGIAGTRNVGEVYDEIVMNRDKLARLLGHVPRFFRPGTAYCDDVALRIVTDLGERAVGFTVNGDAGATYTPAQVEQAVLGVGPGSIVIAHMNHPGAGTARGMAAAIPRLLSVGFAFTRLSEAIPADAGGITHRG